MSSNLAGLLRASTERHAARPLVVGQGDPVTYGEIAGRAERLAGALRAEGVRPGDRVATLLPNTPDAIVAYYGVLRLGAVVVPLNVLLRDAEIRQRLGHSEARALVALPERGAGIVDGLDVTLVDPAVADSAAPVAEIADVDPREPAVILYTSGTSGDPKAAELTHAGLRWAATYTAGPLLGLGPGDVSFGASPLAHIFGLTVVMNATIVGGASIAQTLRFEPESALDLMARTGTTVFLGVPTMCIALLQAAEAAPVLPRFRIAHVGASPVPLEVLEAFAARFGCQMLEGYGLTETGAVIASHHAGRPGKLGSVGPAVEGAEIRVVGLDGGELAVGEVGEVQTRSPGLMRGYWRNPAATALAIDADGWFATGDMGYLDEDGYLFLVDRKKDVILRGGYSVYPREVEEVLYQHPGVAASAVVGVPDARLGEEVVALVVPREGTECDPDEIAGFLKERVAAYKYPRLVVVVTELPRGPSGKILKREIDRTALGEALAAARASA